MSINVFDMIMSPGVYAITGGAGAGKSSLTKSLAKKTGGIVIEMDSFFIGDSAYRASLLLDKAHYSWESYVDACNQMNWWDWSEIGLEIEKHRSGSSNSAIYVEGALLGPEWMWPLYEKIIYVDTPSNERLSRLIKRDGHKRDGLSIARRFLITEYSEQLHYHRLIPYANKTKKLVICDCEGTLHAMIERPERLFLPKEV